MTQSELKQLYADILFTDVWHGDKRMIDYCIKRTAYIVELKNGDIIVLEKESIKKDFCFGYSDSRCDTEDYDRANDAAHHAAKSTDYFLAENLKGIDRRMAELKGEQAMAFNHYICLQYTRQPKNSKLKAIHSFHQFDDRAEGRQPLEGENLKRVIEGYEKVRTDFVRRLNSYLKRYGMSKVNTWSYWRDE